MDYRTYLIRMRQQALEYPDIAASILKKIRQLDYAEQNPMSFGQLDEKHPPSPYPMSFGQSSPYPTSSNTYQGGGKG